MGKITVNHYLNTKAKPNSLTDSGSTKKTYPIYVQIIYKRHSTNKRSDTLIESTIEGFEHYKKTGEALKDEFFTMFSDGFNLTTEKTIITNSIRIIEKNNLPFDYTNLLDIIGYFSKRVGDCLTLQLEKDISIEEWEEKADGSIDSTDYCDFILSFKNTFGIIKSFDNIKKHTNIDLSKFVKAKDLARMKAINLIAVKYYNVSFAEFYCLDYYSEVRTLLKDQTVGFFEEFIAIIEVLMVNYANSGGYVKIFAK